jgi:hypothetical protein
LFKHALGGKPYNPKYEYIRNGKLKLRKNMKINNFMDMQNSQEENKNKN